ncbi:MAG: hypothetical protein JSW66_18060 [Phycisphaerales bacterium]|nr:MAG: hypothetical protein JSW66_18060 [Phycisphaerales bacterium]
MIRFFCEQCGHKISVHEEHAGKRCRCQRCDSVVVVPQRSTTVDFHCEHCGHKITARQGHAGKKGKCPTCEHAFVVPKQAAHTGPGQGRHTVRFACSTCDQTIHILKDLRGELIECPHCGSHVEAPEEQVPEETSNEPAQEDTEDAVDGLSLEERELLGGQIRMEEPERTGERTLPWLADMFLYPASASGMVHVAVFVIAPMLIGLFARFFLMHVRGIGFMLPGILFAFLIAYWFHYFTECIRDSAGGGVRAPETFGGAPGKDEIIDQCLTLLACYAFFFGPATFYRSYAYFFNAEVNNAIFWSLLAYGIFFFPMGMLAVVMFDSINGLNPILLVCSIGCTFFQYFGLFIFFAGLCILRILISTVSLGWPWRIPVAILCNIISVWLLFVAAHLIGRFYWRYKEKLNWEV